MKKLFLFMFGVTYVLLIAVVVLGYVDRKKLAYKILDVQSEDIDQNVVVELRDAANAWSSQRAIDEERARAKARREGIDYTPQRFDFELTSEKIEKFRPEDLAATVSEMRPDTIARIIPRIQNPNTREIVFEKLSPEKKQQVDDWIALRRDTVSLNEEKNALKQQKRRMELFQSSLDRQFQDLRKLQASVREEMLMIQTVQDSMQNQLVEVTSNERANLMKLSRTYSEMSPQRVAAMVENEEAEFDEQKFAKILFMMDEDARAEIFDALQPENVAKYSTAISTLKSESLIQTKQTGNGNFRHRAGTLPSRAKSSGGKY